LIYNQRVARLSRLRSVFTGGLGIGASGGSGFGNDHFLRSQASGTTGASPGFSVSVTYPSSTLAPQVGDIIVLTVAFNGTTASGATISTPSGFNSSGFSFYRPTPSPTYGMAVFIRTATGIESGPVSTSLSGSYTCDMVAQMRVIGGLSVFAIYAYVGGTGAQMHMLVPQGPSFLMSDCFFADSTDAGQTPTIVVPTFITATGSQVTATHNGLGMWGGTRNISSTTPAQNFTQTGITTPNDMTFTGLLT